MDDQVTITTYHRGSTRNEAIQIAWPIVRDILGHIHDGSPEDDEALVSWLVAQGAPQWVRTAEGWIDEHGWGLIGPALPPTVQTEIITYKHPKSGETYAVRLVHGHIAAAAGPLPADETDIEGFLANQTRTDLEDDAAWLRCELGYPPIYGYYNDDGIWATGQSPEEAAEHYLSNLLSSDETELIQFMQVAPMTCQLATRIAENGFDPRRDHFTILPDGWLDL